MCKMDSKELNGWSVLNVNNLQPFIVHDGEGGATFAGNLPSETHVAVVIKAIAFNSASFAKPF